MTEREAFDVYIAGQNMTGATYLLFPHWQAACAWQRGRDAQVCEASGYADAAADAIRAQGKQ